MSFPTKEQRAVCWSARDKLWECLDKYEDPLNRSKLPTECADLRKIYEQGCPAQWVKHFDRKREYLQFKERIEKQGITTDESHYQLCTKRHEQCSDVY